MNRIFKIKRIMKRGKGTIGTDSYAIGLPYQVIKKRGLIDKKYKIVSIGEYIIFKKIK